jgi:ABC-type antimicrobial peptide transport system permease subunit
LTAKIESLFLLHHISFSLIARIAEVYTPDELFLYLKKFTYNFNTDNTKPNQSKDKHIKSIQTYFQSVENVDKLTANPKEFDKQLINAISEKIKTYAK